MNNVLFEKKLTSSTIDYVRLRHTKAEINQRADLGVCAIISVLPLYNILCTIREPNEQQRIRF